MIILAKIITIIVLIIIAIILYWNKDTWGKGGGPGSALPLNQTL